MNYREFRIIQAREESRYRKKLLRYLNRISWVASTLYEKNQSIRGLDLREAELMKIYLDMYKRTTMIAANDELRKDAINDLVNILDTSKNPGEVLKLFRGLLNSFLEVRILDRIKNVNNTTLMRLRRLIQKGVNEGLPPRDVAEMIRADVGYNKRRSIMIARTETVRALNQGRYMAALSSEYQKEKVWISAKDSRTRDSHLFIGYKEEFIPLEDYFILQGRMGEERALYPCDSTLSAANSINCRCTLAFRTIRDEDGNPVRKRN